MSRSYGQVVLVLAGGNALGAYQAGAFEALHSRGVAIDRIVGTSIGAINGALIAGNAPDDRVARLAAMWQPAPEGRGSQGWFPSLETARRTAAVHWTLAAGREHAFVPAVATSWLTPGNGSGALYDTAPLARALTQWVDLERLNAGEIRFSATAVDLESGEDVLFDTAEQRVGVDHLRASGALLPVFPPVEIDGRVYADGGISANLALDVALNDTPDRPTLCLAIDLMPLAGPRPATIGEAAGRAQDLVFAAQTRRTLARWSEVYHHRAQEAEVPLAPLTLVHLAYAAQAKEVGGKAFDFSALTARDRWTQGAEDMAGVLDRIDRGDIALDRPGLSIERVS